jgi:hypothetical protein
VSGREAELQTYLEQNLVPAGSSIFCDIEILHSSGSYDYAEVRFWLYCRSFRVVDGELASGLLLSTMAAIDFYWSPDLDWQIGGYWFDYVLDPQTPWMQRLLENPYDEAAGQERLEERARQALPGE